ncbi:reverse transcriptase [Elysia marginata]|uniref:Reverse transcriptase n=1 Tax=Elysia marginata TaxID=1093978 RepID=A0AAV4ICT9_9GAST|nr:reverse transcriptase [Elysia marginata]
MDYPCICGRRFASERGMKIHRTKMGCLNKSFQQQRTALADKTSENQSRAQNHSAKEIQAEDQDEELRQLINAKRQKTNFPAATAVEQWEDLDSKIVLKLDSLIGDSTLEHKLATSVMATRLTKYLTENGYINTSVQKGGIPGVSGCLKHATMIWEAIQRAKSEKLNLDVVWLDLANAYGSVPHGMIQLALRMYHVPEDIQVMLDDYFSGFRMRFSTSDYTTNWINLEVGIAMGCTISPILIVMAMEVILKAAEGSAGPANLGGGCSMPPLKAFMDDTTIICSKEEETRRMLALLDTLMAWCRMKFKPKKSRSLSIRNGKIEEAVTFTAAEQQIPTVSQEPVKSLGRWYDSSMKDTRRGVETVQFAS